MEGIEGSLGTCLGQRQIASVIPLLELPQGMCHALAMGDSRYRLFRVNWLRAVTNVDEHLRQYPDISLDLR